MKDGSSKKNMDDEEKQKIKADGFAFFQAAFCPFCLFDRNDSYEDGRHPYSLFIIFLTILSRISTIVFLANDTPLPLNSVNR